MFLIDDGLHILPVRIGLVAVGAIQLGRLRGNRLIRAVFPTRQERGQMFLMAELQLRLVRPSAAAWLKPGDRRRLNGGRRTGTELLIWRPATKDGELRMICKRLVTLHARRVRLIG